jgi:hypothetical protein
MKDLKEWFLINSSTMGGSVDKYLTHYCLNIFLRLYDGKEETQKLHNFPPSASIPEDLKDFYKRSFVVQERPTTYDNVIHSWYFEPYRKLHIYIMQGGRLTYAQSHKLAYSLYTHVHMNRVSIMSLEPWVLCFIERSCKKESEEFTKSSVLYSKFVEWIDTIWDCGLTSERDAFETYRISIRGLVSQKAFTSILKSSAGLKPVRKSDGIYWPGISLGAGKRIEVSHEIITGYEDKEYGAPI